MILLSKRIILPALALAGLGAAAVVIVGPKQAPETTKALAEPATAPFASYIGGTGQLEPQGKTVGIGAHESGIVVGVPFKPGDHVQAGQICSGSTTDCGGRNATNVRPISPWARHRSARLKPISAIIARS